MSYATCRIVLINPPQTALTRRSAAQQMLPRELQVLAQSLMATGLNVLLLDAAREELPLSDICQRLSQYAPHVILLGGLGDADGLTLPPQINALAQSIQAVLPQAILIYHGGAASDHWQDLLNLSPAIHFVRRGVGQQSSLTLCQALAAVLRQSHLPPSRLRLWVKHIEAAIQRAAQPLPEDFARAAPMLKAASRQFLLPLAVQVLDPLGFWRAALTRLSALRLDRA